MKKTIEVAIARPPSITMTEGFISAEEKISATGSSGTFVKPAYSADFYVALTDGDKVIYELPVSEERSVDLLNKLLEHFELFKVG